MTPATLPQGRRRLCVPWNGAFEYCEKGHVGAVGCEQVLLSGEPDLRFKVTRHGRKVMGFSCLLLGYATGMGVRMRSI